MWDSCSSLTYYVWSVISTVGYSCSAFAVAPRLLARPAVWYHPKVSDAFGCRARVACPAVALCLGFCFMLRLAAISTGLWLFLEAGSFIEYLLMFQCELAHSSAFQIASALNGSAPRQGPLCTRLNLQLLIYHFNYGRHSHLNLYLISWNINKFLNHIIKHNNILNLVHRLFCL